MAQAFQPQDDGRQTEGSMIVIGIYTCLLCEESFSKKVELKLHYCSEHWECIPDYEGSEKILRSS